MSAIDTIGIILILVGVVLTAAELHERRARRRG